MPPPPVLSNFTPPAVPWRVRPWNRWTIIAVPLSVLSAICAYIFLQCSTTWLMRPSHIEKIGVACMLILLASFAVSIIAIKSSSRQRTVQRGNTIAGFTFLVTFLSFGLFLALLGPAADVPRFRFENATRDNQWKIVRQLEAYREVHGKYPPHLAVLLISHNITPQDLLDPFSDTKAYTLPPGLTSADWSAIAADVDKHSDLIYTAGDLPRLSSDKFIILYDKPMAERDGRVMTIGNYDVRYIPLADFSACFAGHNAERAANGLPAHRLDVQPTIPVTATTSSGGGEK